MYDLFLSFLMVILIIPAVCTFYTADRKSKNTFYFKSVYNWSFIFLTETGNIHFYLLLFQINNNYTAYINQQDQQSRIYRYSYSLFH